MAEYKDIRRDFVSRTQELLKACPKNDARDVTKLINYAYGLITYPKGQIHHSKWPKYQFNGTNTSYGITSQNIKYSSGIPPKYNLYQIIRHVRNGLSHGYIEGEYDARNIIGIKIEDRDKANSPVNFTLEASIEQFRIFALKVSEDYLAIYDKLYPQS